MTNENILYLYAYAFIKMYTYRKCEFRMCVGDMDLFNVRFH